MLSLYILLGLCGLAGLGFLLEPLVRDEESLGSLTTRPDSSLRSDAPTNAPTDAPTETRERTTTAEPGRRCPHCGADVEQGYVFCGTCAGPLPTPA
jgi:hypothetical protein